MKIWAVEKEVFEGFRALAASAHVLLLHPNAMKESTEPWVSGKDLNELMGKSEEFQDFRCFDAREKTLGDERWSVFICPFQAPFLPQLVVQWMFGIRPGYFHVLYRCVSIWRRSSCFSLASSFPGIPLWPDIQWKRTEKELARSSASFWVLVMIAMVFLADANACRSADANLILFALHLIELQIVCCLSNYRILCATVEH